MNLKLYTVINDHLSIITSSSKFFFESKWFHFTQELSCPPLQPPPSRHPLEEIGSAAQSVVLNWTGNQCVMTFRAKFMLIVYLEALGTTLWLYIFRFLPLNENIYNQVLCERSLEAPVMLKSYLLQVCKYCSREPTVRIVLALNYIHIVPSTLLNTVVSVHFSFFALQA